MKTLFQIETLLLGVLLAASSAQAGGNSGGGGNELVAQFVSSANSLLGKVSFSHNHRMLLVEGLKANIVSVDVLKNERGQPIADQANLIAYAWKGHIQLKNRALDGSGDSWQTRFEEKRSLAHHIVHELIRASGATGADGKSIDDVYQISIGTYKLDQFRTHRLETRVLAASDVLRHRGVRYCDGLSELYGKRFHAETIRRCLVVTESERQVGFTLITGNLAAFETALAVWRRDADDLCANYSQKPWGDVRGKCKDLVDVQAKMLNSLIDEDTGALNIHLDDLNKRTEILAEAMMLEAIVYASPCKEKLRDWSRAFGAFVNELVGWQAAKVK